MRSIAGLRADLQALESRLAEFDPASSLTPGAALMRRGLAEIRDDLRGDLRDARRARVDVILGGLPVQGHEVRIDALAKLLHSFQESVSSVAQSLVGKATARASIPGPLREATALNLSAVFAGSFGATLRGPVPTAEEEYVLFEADEAVPTLLDEAVTTVLRVVDLAAKNEPSEDSIVEAVLPLGARSFKHLNDLSATIVDEEMSAQISFTSPSAEPQTAILNRPTARALSDALSRNRMTEDQEVLTGRLGTVSDIRSRIELQTDTGIVQARVVDEVVPLLAHFYTRRVSATFDVAIIRSLVTGVERRSYLLVGLADAGDDPTLPEADA